jgi:hypothetical protein
LFVQLSHYAEGTEAFASLDTFGAMRSKVFTLGKTKKNLIFFGFSEIFTTFAADFKGCLRVQAEMIPSNLIRIMPA